MTRNKVDQSFLSLKMYIENEKFKGWDPFDGLNSTFFKSLPFNNFKLFKWVWIQVFKRNPINLRKVLGVPKDYNAKGIGLLLFGYCQLYKIAKNGENKFGDLNENLAKINVLYDILVKIQSRDYSGACWGYNFDWQNRVFFQPAYTPTVVATSFVASALFEAYEVTQEKKFLKLAISSCDFVMKDLNRSYTDDGGLIFSYSPLDHSQVYNASLLGARLLAQGYSYTSNKEWLELARKATWTICGLQDEEGAWVYGKRSNQQWIDSFHTGFNLECIFEYKKFTGDDSFKECYDKGLAYYLTNFFLEDGTPKYYHNRVYPIDIHSPAQFLVTLIKTEKFNDNEEMADRVLDFTLKKMQDKHGFFYYQLKRFFSTKISYLRWSQAWMFYSMTLFLKEKQKVKF
jgi:rhamnogalacturonyl hydrolase YesR